MIKIKKDFSRYDFKEQELKVDYLNFNKQFRTKKDRKNDISTISNYLSINFDFNCDVIFTNSKRTTRRVICETENSIYKFRFIIQTEKYNNVLTISFSNEHAAYFYNLIKSKKINWEIFELNYISLSRIDICYFRLNKSLDTNNNNHKFIKECCNQVNERTPTKKTELHNNKKGLVLWVGDRHSQRFYRIYTFENGIRFELEIKKEKAAQVQSFLFSSDFEKFEDILTKEFYKYSNSVIVINHSFADWLRHYNWQAKNLQKYKSNKSNKFLVTNYLNKIETKKNSPLKSLNEIKQFQSLLQFLTFTSQLETRKTYTLEDQEYYLLEFFLMDFLKFLGKSSLSIGQANYQRQKIKKFFDDLQNNAPIIEFFSEKSFQRSISIPYYKLIRTGRNYIVKLAVAPELYNQKYPFKLPEKFLVYENSYDLRIKLKLIEVLSQSEIEKQFFFKEFLDHLAVSNTKKTYIKHKIIELLLELEKERVIHSNFIFIDKNNNVKKLDSLNNFDKSYFIQLQFIYFYENLY